MYRYVVSLLRCGQVSHDRVVGRLYLAKPLVFSFFFVIFMFSVGCDREEATHDHIRYYLDVCSDKKAQQNLRDLEKSDSVYLNSLLHLELRAVFNSQAPDRQHLRELDSLLGPQSTKSQKAILHLLKSRAAFGRDYYESYREARASAGLFESTKDTEGLVCAYRNLAYRYPTDASMNQMGNKDDTKYYRNRYVALLKNAKDPHLRLSYLFTLLNDDTIASRPVRYYEHLATRIMDTANKLGVANKYENSIQLAISAVYQRKKLQGKIDSILEVRQRNSKPNYEYVDLFDMIRHSNNKDDHGNYVRVIESAIASYKRNHIDNPNFLITAYGMLEADFRMHGDFRNAYLYKTKRDSMASIQDVRLAESRMTNVESTYKLKQKETEVEAARKSRQRFVIFSLVTAVLALMAAVLGYYNYRSRRRIEALYERDGDIKRVISHDVLSPLSSLEMLNRQLSSVLDPGSKAVEMTRRQQLYIQNINTLCHNLVGWLWHAKSDRAQAALLGPLLEDLFSELEGFISSYDATVTREVDDRVAEAEVADPNALRTVLRNLLSNSLRHGNSKHVALRFTKEGGKIRIVLSDDGKPIDAELREMLTRLLNGKSDGKSMTGLGMYLAGRFLSTLKGQYHIQPSGEPGFHNEHIVEIPIHCKPGK